MDNKTLLQKVQGCLMGVAIGDALGMPVETMWHEDILRHVNSGLGVTGFIDPVQRRITDTQGLKAGDTTDDWQLTAAVARSLVRTKGSLSITDCANEHIMELAGSTFGWGKGTQSAIEALRDGVRKPGEPLPKPEKGKGCGNGVIMKIAPIAIAAYLQRFTNEELWDEIRALGTMTHPDLQASIAAYAVALVIMQALGRQGEGGDMEHVFDKIVLIDCASNLEFATSTRKTPEGVSTKIVAMKESLSTAEALRKAVGCGFHAPETAAFTIGTYLRHPTDFRAGVLEAVNAGGDTDTNASIVGALIGARVGIRRIPEEWKTFNPAFAAALNMGEALFWSCGGSM